MVSDYMSAGIDKLGKSLEKRGLEPNQPLPGREDPPAPGDDREGAGMAMNELVTEEVGNLIDEETPR